MNYLNEIFAKKEFHKLGFGKYFCDSVFVQYYSPDKGWHNGNILNKRHLSVDLACQVLHSGSDIFEGLKAYYNPNGGFNFFRIKDNLNRFNLSAERMGMPKIDVTIHKLIIEKLVNKEASYIPNKIGCSMYIRPVMFGSEPTLQVRASREFIHFVLLSPVGPYFGNELNCISIYVEQENIRAAYGGTGNVKTTANYAQSIQTSEKVFKLGFDQVLWLDAIHKKYIEELSGMNIMFLYKDKTLRTPTLSGTILPGITRDTIITLSKSLGYNVIEDQLDINQILHDINSNKIIEAFAVGTGAVVAPIGKLFYKDSEYIINNQKVGENAQQIFNQLINLQHGIVQEDNGWLTNIK